MFQGFNGAHTKAARERSREASGELTGHEAGRNFACFQCTPRLKSLAVLQHRENVFLTINGSIERNRDGPDSIFQATFFSSASRIY